MDSLVDKIRQHDRRSLAEAMSLVDSDAGEAARLKDLLRGATAGVPWWGFTGPPGVGKSTLIDALLTRLRAACRRVGVLALDPTSPVSDGALLGDRVRMMRHAEDRDVFIRSLATRRCAGGLSDATLHCARLLELGGFDPVLIETVGVGQNEADIASIADFCVVLLGPGYGDDIQLIKAGLLEIADIVVVNKCDMPEAQRLLGEVREELRHSARAAAESDGGPAIFGIEAKSGKGVELLLEHLLARDQSARNDAARQRARSRRVLSEIRRSALRSCAQTMDRALADFSSTSVFEELVRGRRSLSTVASQLGADALAALTSGAGDNSKRTDAARNTRR